ncbi:[FeFe] hydrogenase H-cluster radical SAM maturase HydE [Ilyobacter sp.]|uniref:[FeFe] hydrogenase H-cluster radical SAM maturase HydE n=1 Tax=Ilyobacter sp. TaxID=3100343 RepID=UPI0035623DDF
MKTAEILNKEKLTREDLLYLMNIENPEDINLIYEKAYEIKEREIGKKVFYRGLIEFSNNCIKDCSYCGIRKSSKNVERFFMSKEDILESAKWIYENNYGSLVLQSGERQDEEFTAFVEDVVKEIKNLSQGKLGITLSLGEQSKETYKRWFDAGAHRYLLRVETSNEELYKKIHPQDKKHDFDVRIRCLEDLRNTGYQVGTGVMIGLPGQTSEDLVEDILFYEKMDVDMIGMGPYIISDETPMGEEYRDKIMSKEKRVTLGLKMIALSRIYLKDINIAATTALQGLDPLGREKGLKAGANVLMPVTTKGEHRAKYQLYNDKPCIDDTAEQCKGCLAGRVKSVGDEIAYGEWGDSPHYIKRKSRS